MPRTKIQIVSLTGAQLTPATLQAMSDLRRAIMRMKPGIDLARDFDKFSRFCRHACYVYLLYAPGQQLVGSMVFVADDTTASDGTAYVAVQIEYVFLAPAYRGHPALPLAFLRLIFRFLWRMLWHLRGRQVWLCGVGYPASLAFFNDFVPTSWIGSGRDSQPDMPLVAHEILQNLAQDCGPDGWDAVRQRAIMPTVPPEMPPLWHEKMQANPFYQQYLALCPDWREGFALPGTGRLRWRATLWRVLEKGLRRKRQRD